MRTGVTLILAAVLSALAVAAGVVAFIYAAALAESASPTAVTYLRFAALSFAITLPAQLVVGTLLWRVLEPRGLFQLPTVVAAYVVPVVAAGLLLANTTMELEGTVPWVTLAVLASTVFWAVARTLR